MIKKRPKSNPRSRSNTVERPTTRTKNFSYYEARSSRQSDVMRRNSHEENITPKNKRTLPRVSTVIITVLILLFGYFELTIGGTPKVIIMNRNNATSVLLKPVSVYESAAAKDFNKSISNSVKLSVNIASITTELRQQFPELASVSVTIPIIGRQPTIELSVSQPVLIISTADSSRMLVSASGKVIATDSSKQIIQEFNNKLPIVSYAALASVREGEVAIASSDVSFIEQVNYQLTTQHIGIQSMEVPAGTRELDVHIIGEPYYVKFDLHDDVLAGQQIGTFIATKDYLSAQHITPAYYIDARIPGRVFYK